MADKAFGQWLRVTLVIAVTAVAVTLFMGLSHGDSITWREVRPFDGSSSRSLISNRNGSTALVLDSSNLITDTVISGRLQARGKNNDAFRYLGESGNESFLVQDISGWLYELTPSLMVQKRLSIFSDQLREAHHIMANYYLVIRVNYLLQIIEVSRGGMKLTLNLGQAKTACVLRSGKFLIERFSGLIFVGSLGLRDSLVRLSPISGPVLEWFALDDDEAFIRTRSVIACVNVVTDRCLWSLGRLAEGVVAEDILRTRRGLNGMSIVFLIPGREIVYVGASDGVMHRRLLAGESCFDIVEHRQGKVEFVAIASKRYGAPRDRLIIGSP